ncbi:hypothetical protein PMZ80_000059 [Knufia obscura]|uniref:Uncharacterized protein n=2 Tax=Knufia TaxID=430999 RepID=A0AAN8E9V6_9EURO|nr:hypothetical protein PMZ80_000059 [Knufia obscura]KAK5948760.1 hypothetical protein OHC33_010183 [Knufia fluminis]
MGLFTWLWDWLLYLFWSTEMDVTIVGLQNAGKTSLVRVLAGQDFTLDSIPTVAFNKREVKKGHVSIRCWDLGGQVKFRNMWERYCRDVNAIIFVVDAADRDAIVVAKDELHSLLGHETLEGIPLLVLANKSDVSGKMSVDEVIEGLELKRVVHREISCYGVSAKEETNLEAVLQWLVARSGK